MLAWRKSGFETAANAALPLNCNFPASWKFGDGIIIMMGKNRKFFHYSL
jgi:hypothetical protein